MAYHRCVLQSMHSGLTSLRSGALVMLLLSGGCATQAELAYSPREELKELPQRQQQQIEAALATYFGTPRFPKFMENAPEDKQPADAKEPLLIERFDRVHLRQGRDVYTRQCSGCHGTTGDGKGPAAAYLN